MYYKIGTDTRGIRFLATLKVNGETDKDIVSSNAFQTGMLICTEDSYYTDLEENVTLEKVGPDHPMLVNAANTTDKTKKWMTNRPGSFACGVVNIQDHNITRNFMARGYVMVNFVGEDNPEVVYGNVTYPYSIQWIAEQVYNDKDAYDNLPDWKRDIVDYCKDYE